MFMRYLHKHHKREHLLSEAESELHDFQEYLHKFYSGIQVAGMTVVFTEGRADDMIVNAVNGSEADCVLSVLSSPLQEEFIVKNRNLLNLRIWMNLGKEFIPVCKKKTKQKWFKKIIVKRILKKEID